MQSFLFVISILFLGLCNNKDMEASAIDERVNLNCNVVYTVENCTSHSDFFHSKISLEACNEADCSVESSKFAAYMWVPRLLRRIISTLSSSRGARLTGSILKGLGLSLIANEITRHFHSEFLTESERDALKDLQQFVTRLETSIEQNNGDIATIRSEMERHYGYTTEYLNSLDNRISQIDKKLVEHELEIQRLIQQGKATQKQLAKIQRTIIDNQNQIIELNNAVVDHEGRILSLEEKVLTNEQAIEENRLSIRGNRELSEENRRRINRDGYYNKHTFSIGGQVLYSGSTVAGNEGSLGASIEISYLFNEMFGVYSQGVFAPIRASTTNPYYLSSDTTRSADLLWDNYSVGVGVFFDLIPGDFPLTFRLGAAGGISINEFIENPSDAQFFERSDSAIIENQINPVLLAKADLGFSPPRFPFEPYISIGFSSLLNPVKTNHPSVDSSNFGKTLRHYSIGIRWRFSSQDQFMEGIGDTNNN